MIKGMVQPVPHIRCVDVWAKGLPAYAKDVYSAFAQKGELQKVQIIISKTHPIVIFEYLANCPHEWMLRAMAKEVRT